MQNQTKGFKTRKRWHNPTYQKFSPPHYNAEESQQLLQDEPICYFSQGQSEIDSTLVEMIKSGQLRRHVETSLKQKQKRVTVKGPRMDLYPRFVKVISNSKITDLINSFRCRFDQAEYECDQNKLEEEIQASKKSRVFKSGAPRQDSIIRCHKYYLDLKTFQIVITQYELLVSGISLSTPPTQLILWSDKTLTQFERDRMDLISKKQGRGQLILNMKKDFGQKAFKDMQSHFQDVEQGPFLDMLFLEMDVDTRDRPGYKVPPVQSDKMEVQLYCPQRQIRRMSLNSQDQK